MAYKFQLGDAIMSGALEQEEGITSTTISGSGRISGGSMILDGELALQSAGISAAGAIAGATTIAASGLASLDGGINVNDDFTVNADGAVVAVGVNAGGAVSGVTTLDGSGDLTMGTITMSGFSVDADGDTTAKSLSGSGDITYNGSLTMGGGLIGSTISGSSTLSAVGAITTAGGLALQASGITAAGAIAGATSVSGSGAGSFGSMTLDGALALQSAGITAAGAIAGATTISGSGNLSSAGTLTVAGGFNNQSSGIVFAGNITGAGNISGSGDVDCLNVDAADNIDAGNSYSLGGTTIVTSARRGQFSSVSASSTTSDIGGTLQMNGNIVPAVAAAAGSGLHNLGSATHYFGNIYVDTIHGGNIAWTVESVGNGATIAAGTEFALVTAGNMSQVTLPAAAAGRNVRVKLSASVGDVILKSGTGDLIEGATQVRLESTGSAVTCVALDGQSWFIV